MTKKQQHAGGQLLHGIVTDGVEGCGALRVVHFCVTGEGISFLKRTGEGHNLLPFDVMRVRKAACDRRGTLFRGKEQFPALYVRDRTSLELIREQAPPRIQKHLAAWAPAERSLSDSVRIAAGGIVAVVAMLWAIPSI
jgi:hypothetical protein